MPSATRATRADLKRLPIGKPGASCWCVVAADDHRRLVLGHEPRGELGRRHVEVLQRRGALELLGLLRHQRRPLPVEVDEVLRDHLAFGRVRRQQGLRACALEHLAELPPQIPAVLHRHVHALTGLGAVGVARVARDEDARRAGADLVEGDVVEAVGEAVADLVHAVPGDVLHVEPVRVQDVVRLRDDLVERGLAHRAVIVRRHLAEVDVHPEQEAAFARDEQDVARLGLDRALRADVGEVGDRERIHHAPGVEGLRADVLRADGLAHTAAGAVCADDVLGPHDALLPGQLARRCA